MAVYSLKVMEEIKVIGKISLDDGTPKTKCTCDDCGEVVNDSFGDPRNRVTTKWDDGRYEERWICDACADEQFGDHSSYSIFG